MAMSNLVAALAEARKDMKMPKLNGVGHAGRNGCREYKYALLVDVLDCIVPPLAERGVLLTQGIDEAGFLSTTARMGEEELVLDRRRVNLSGTSQEQGSAETYAKRYALCTVFCISGIEDDDGEAASNRPPVRENPGPVTDARKFLWTTIKEYAAKQGITPEEALEGVKKRPEWESQQHSAEWLMAVAREYSELANG